MRKTSTVLAIVLLFAGLLALNGCKSEDPIDITGTWTMTVNGGYSWTMTFVGSATSGSITDTYPQCVGNGTYTVTDTQISFTVNYPCGPYIIQFSGTITSETYMSGTWLDTVSSDTGTWTASR